MLFQSKEKLVNCKIPIIDKNCDLIVSYLAGTITDAVCGDDLALLGNTPDQAECYILTFDPAQKYYSKVIHRKEVTHSNGQ